MTSITEDQVKQALSKVVDPELNRSIVELGMVRNVQVDKTRVRFTLVLTTPECPLRDQIVAEAKGTVLALEGVEEVEVDLAEMTDEEKQRLGIKVGEQAGVAEGFNHIRHVVAVMSGKGGAGKSLVSALLAVALRREGQQVGVLDADITGPSIPKMFFPTLQRPKGGPIGILPVQTREGIKVMSINLLLPSEDEPVIWRGPIISTAIKQFWGDVSWGDLDWLVVDLPPGTSDAALTVMQSLPLSGVVLVTSPQELAEMVVRKAAQMAQVLRVPILGLIENMSYFVCPSCNRRHEIFGHSHGEEMAQRLKVAFLGRLPIDPSLSELCDTGNIEAYPMEAFASIVHSLMKTAPELLRSPVQPHN